MPAHGIVTCTATTGHRSQISHRYLTACAMVGTGRAHVFPPEVEPHNMKDTGFARERCLNMAKKIATSTHRQGAGQTGRCLCRVLGRDGGALDVFAALLGAGLVAGAAGRSLEALRNASCCCSRTRFRSWSRMSRRSFRFASLDGFKKDICLVPGWAQQLWHTEYKADVPYSHLIPPLHDLRVQVALQYVKPEQRESHDPDRGENTSTLSARLSLRYCTYKVKTDEHFVSGSED